MGKLAHAALGVPGFAAEKKAAASQAQHEIIEAKRLMQEHQCTYTEALRMTYTHPFLNTNQEE